MNVVEESQSYGWTRTDAGRMYDHELQRVHEIYLFEARLGQYHNPNG